ncbi:MAG: DUF1573 domain-containing protein [Desulfobacteraceae bacterium]|nr:DUF1573 domain-containing protein [Desulfobacteraceae bacterium]
MTVAIPLIFLICLIHSPLQAEKTDPQPQEKKADGAKSPKAIFPQTEFEFSPVMEGDEITHDFVIENQGTADLVIKSVKPD